MSFSQNCLPFIPLFSIYYLVKQASLIKMGLGQISNKAVPIKELYNVITYVRIKYTEARRHKPDTGVEFWM